MNEVHETPANPEGTHIRRTRTSPAGRAFAAGAGWGLLAGFVVGGVGGRIFMMVLRFTSSDSLVGVRTDDGFTIGRFSSETMFLITSLSVVGSLLGIGYVLVRGWLPVGFRPAQAAAFWGVVGGASILRPGGVDFTELSPLPLAVLMFIALPAAYGWLLSWLVEGTLGKHPAPSGRLEAAWNSPAVTWIGRVAIGAVGVVQLAQLFRDIDAIV